MKNVIGYNNINNKYALRLVSQADSYRGQYYRQYFFGIWIPDWLFRRLYSSVCRAGGTIRRRLIPGFRCRYVSGDRRIARSLAVLPSLVRPRFLDRYSLEWYDWARYS